MLTAHVILILFGISNPAVGVTAIEFSSQEACHAAFIEVHKAQPAIFGVCVPK